MDWTDEQRAILDHPLDAHAVVRAVPGSGKTTTLVGRVVRMCELGVDPSRIRVVMFNKAIQQTCERRLREAGVAGVRVSTFDALGLAVLHAAEREGLLTRRLEVVPEGTAVWAREVHRAHRQDIAGEEDIADAVAFWKAHLVAPPRAVCADAPALVAAYRDFEELRLAGDVLRVGFEDMVYTAVGLLRRRPRLLGRIDHFLVDEFQDVNPGRVELLQRLAHPGTAVFAVGDEDQGINEWCGAHPRFLREFAATFPGLPTRVYPLSRSFRFGRNLADAAAALIRRNEARTPVDLVGGGVTAGHLAEVDDVGEQVQRLLSEGWAPGDLAVLYRGRAQAVGVLATLLGVGVPVHTADVELLRRGRGPELALAYLHFACARGPLRAEDAWPVVRAPDRYIRKDPFFAQARAASKGLPALLRDRRGAERAGQAPGALRSMADLADLLERMGRCARAGEALTLLRDEVDVEEQLRAYLPEGAQQDLAVVAFDAVHRLLGGLGVGPADAADALARLDPLAGAAPGASVWVSTIHRAKGMEWRCVLLPALQEGLCPLAERDATLGSVDEPDGVEQSPWTEQERRIFYVGVTRACDQVLLERPGGRPSRFLTELRPAPPATAPPAAAPKRRRAKQAS